MFCFFLFCTNTNRDFFILLANPTNATISLASGRVTILDDDPLPTLSVTNISFNEKAGSQTGAVFQVKLSQVSSVPVSVRYFTLPGTATTNLDFISASGLLSFNPAVTTQSVRVTVLDDTLNEPNETFFLVLTNATNATISVSQATATIVDDDPPPSLSIADKSVAEGNVGNTSLVMSVTLSAPSGKIISCDVLTVSGTALAGKDFVAATNHLTFNPGVISNNFTVQIIGNKLYESDKFFTLRITNVVNGTVARGTATVTILNDDLPNSPPLAVIVWVPAVAAEPVVVDSVTFTTDAATSP